ncbi:MAG TPA: HmuY family protein [Flavobacterium sp.]|nr:HmuY family protein [Flavobacterium sp.]
MKIKFYLFSILLFALVFSACEKDETDLSQAFVAAFEKQSYDYSQISGEKEMKLVFSETAKTSGSIVISITAQNAQYAADFATFPETVDGKMEIPFSAGQKGVTFTFKNLIFPFDSDDKSVLLSIVKINYAGETSIQGYKTSLISFERSLGTDLQPEIGGPNQGDQVYIDLSTEAVTNVRRDSWDLGFYSGDHFRVTLNGSIYMAAKNLEATNIDAVTPASVLAFQNEVAVGTFDPANTNYVDAPNGNILQTAIAEVSSDPENNKVYLVNMGYEVGTAIPNIGSVAIAGNPRGWKKIRILKNGEDYVLQYANLESTTHQEVTIPKNAAFNFTFFSFNTQSIVNVEPEKTKWDLNFTVFTNEIEGAGSYGYSDFVVNNLKAGIKAYRVNTSVKSYAQYALADVNDANFIEDQRVIGAEWRDVFTGAAYTDRYYVLKDSDGNYYKIRMLAFINDGGVRGFPKFEYKLLQ